MSKKVLLADNGTLMRGLELENNLKQVGATFIKESKTEKVYRLYSINDKYPAMVKGKKGQAIAVEVYELTEEGMKKVLSKEPKGLTIDKIKLITGEEVYGVIGEGDIINGQKDITSYKGWKKYIDSRRPIKRAMPLIIKGAIIAALLLVLLILSLLKNNQEILVFNLLIFRKRKKILLSWLNKITLNYIFGMMILYRQMYLLIM